MNLIKSLIAVVATVASIGAFAQEATIDTTSSRSIESRTSVHNQAVAARAAGAVAHGEASGHDFSANVGTSLSRAQVAAEAREAQRLGLTQGGEVQIVATANQLESIRRAGQDAVGRAIASR